MTYIALLRGINVGGNNKVPMAQLKRVLESLGCQDVKTYINSGNVLFNDERSIHVLQSVIDRAFIEAFGFEIKTLIIDKPTLMRVAKALPAELKNDDTMRTEVLFLWDDKNTPEVLDESPAVSGVDTVTYVNGALIWSVVRKNVTKSGLPKLIGTKLYKQMTGRNCNTVRKLAELADQL